jgi:hypothetical protein
MDQRTSPRTDATGARLQIHRLEERIAPAITLVNPAGNEPQGDAQGQAIESQNPAGHAPPGQNK